MTSVGSSVKQRTVVVVDDDQDVRASVADLLIAAGYEAVCFAGGGLALTYLCQNQVPDLVLVDLLMPGMNAWELVGQMRRRENLANVPVIIMTGTPQFGSPVPEHMVLAKPIDPTKLLELVQASTAHAVR
jgi:CheY-like chemotaxis protein